MQLIPVAVVMFEEEKNMIHDLSFFLVVEFLYILREFLVFLLHFQFYLFSLFSNILSVFLRVWFLKYIQTNKQIY